MSDPRVSSFCSGGDCVEVARLAHGSIRVTSTREPTRELVYTPAEWDAFVAGVKAGEFDRDAL